MSQSFGPCCSHFISWIIARETGHFMNQVRCETGLLNVLVDNNVSSSFFCKPVVRVLIDYKWKTYAQGELRLHCE